MIEQLDILSAGGDRVTARLARPPRPGAVGIVLAHGAGAGQEHPWMVTMRDGLAAAGYLTLTFDYAYIAAGRRSPDRAPRLLDVHRSAVERLAEEVDTLVLAGKSMGGRMASHLVGEEGVAAAGLVYYGYPLVPPGKAARPTDHLAAITVPQLFFAGTRDRLSPPPLIEGIVVRLPRGELVMVDDGDHSFRVPKRSGRTDSEVLADLVTRTADWVGRRVPAHGGG